MDDGVIRVLQNFINGCFWKIINDPLAYITSNKELCSVNDDSPNQTAEMEVDRTYSSEEEYPSQ
jgi:hypothetical protein